MPPRLSHRGQASMQKVARTAGVSLSAVSYALRPGRRAPFISEKTRQRVLKVAAGLNYRINQSASRLRRGRHDSIAIACDLLAEPSFVEVTEGILRYLTATPYAGMIAMLGGVADVEGFVQSHLASHAHDAIIFVRESDRYPVPMFRRLHERGIRMAVVRHDRIPLKAPSVCGDRPEAGRLMIETLASHGHRRIAFVIWDVNLPGFQNVEASVRKEAERLGVQLRWVRPKPLWNGVEDFKTGLSLARSHFRKSAETAIAVFADTLAVGIFQGLRSMGIRVPDQRSIVSYGGSHLSDYQVPPLSYISHPLGAMGASIARKTVDWIESDFSENQITHEQFQPQYTAKGTVATLTAR